MKNCCLRPNNRRLNINSNRRPVLNINFNINSNRRLNININSNDINSNDTNDINSNDINSNIKILKFRAITKNDSKFINYECCICLKKYTYESIATILECEHIFHKECLEKWFTKKKNCPICQL